VPLQVDASMVIGDQATSNPQMNGDNAMRLRSFVVAVLAVTGLALLGGGVASAERVSDVADPAVAEALDW
jgi:hypothetical protein